MQLLNVPFPKHDEGLKSYLIRLRDHSGYEIGTLMSRLGLSNFFYKKEKPLSMLDINRFSLETLSTDTGIELSVLNELTFTAHNSDLLKEYLFAYISPKRILASRIKICPLCVNEDEYLRKHWELLFFTACPVHNILLIDNCPKCNEKVSIEHLNRCYNCDNEFAQRTYNQILNENELTLSRLLLEKVSRMSSDHPLLGHLSIVDLHKLLFMILLESEFNQIFGDKYAVINEYPIEVIHPITFKIMDVFTDWPANFHEYLKQYKSKRKSQSQEGVVKDFGSLYAVLYKQFKDEQFEFMREEFENYINHHWIGHIRKVPRMGRSTVKYISGHEVFEKYGINYTNILRLINLGLINGKIIERDGSNRFLVEERSIVAYLEKLGNTLSSYKAAEYLGVSQYTLLDLLDHKCISALRGPLVDGYSHWHFEKDSLDNIFHRFEECIVPLNPIENESVLKFRTIVQGNKYPCTTGRFVKLILEGKIRPCGKREGKGISIYNFREKDILNFFTDEISKPKNNLSISEVALTLKMKSEEISKLIKCGIIPGRLNEKGNRTTILREDLEKFIQKHISLAELCAINTAHVPFMLRIMSSLGFEPITSSKDNLVYLYEREEVMQNLSSIEEKLRITPILRKSRRKIVP